METQILNIPVAERVKATAKVIEASCCAPKNDASACCAPSQSAEDNNGACCAQPADGSACCDK